MKMTLWRTRPVEGEFVQVKVEMDGLLVGELSFPFMGWLKFTKLLSAGMEKQLGEASGQAEGLLRVAVKGWEKDVPPLPTPVGLTLEPLVTNMKVSPGDAVEREMDSAIEETLAEVFREEETQRREVVHGRSRTETNPAERDPVE